MPNLISNHVEHQRVHDIASSLGQNDLLKYWDSLSSPQKKKLAKQIESLDLAALQMQKRLLQAPETISMHHLSPFTDYAIAGNAADKARGKAMIAQGLVGCLVVAGGQGTRLRFDGPKGICPVTFVKKKSLFQLIAEKTIAAGKQAGRLLPLAIMTSPANHEATVAFFEENNLFGLDRNQLTFFTQGSLPLLNKDGNLFLEAPDLLSEGPDGNGGALHEFSKQGVWNTWQQRGVRFVNFILVDNPLADPFDAELIGFHDRKGSDIVVKATMRRDAAEKVGVLAREGTKAVVVEYSELSDRDRSAVDENGVLRYPVANISLFSFTMDFIHAVVSNAQKPMMLHKAFKAVKYLDGSGKTIQAESPMAWKFEKFIFDVLPMASKVDALLYPRESCFAPLKNFNGSDSLETVPEAIEACDRKVLSEITGIPCKATPLEIAQDFYYPTPALLKAWKGRTVENGYIGFTQGFNL